MVIVYNYFTNQTNSNNERREFKSAIKINTYERRRHGQMSRDKRSESSTRLFTALEEK